MLFFTSYRLNTHQLTADARNDTNSLTRYSTIKAAANDLRGSLQAFCINRRISRLLPDVKDL